MFKMFFILLKVVVSRTFVLTNFLLITLCFMFSILDQGRCRCVLSKGALAVSIVCKGQCHGATRVVSVARVRIATPGHRRTITGCHGSKNKIQLPGFSCASCRSSVPCCAVVIVRSQRGGGLLLSLGRRLLFTLGGRCPSGIFTWDNRWGVGDYGRVVGGGYTRGREVRRFSRRLRRYGQLW